MSIGFIAYQEAAEKAISIAVAIEKNAPSKRRMAHQPNMRNKTINSKAYRKAMEKATSFRGEKKRVLRTCQHSFRYP
jgi:hypothetical protein